MIDFMYLHRNGASFCGEIPSFLVESDPRPAREQLSGWVPVEGWDMDHETGMIYYPGEPPFYPVAEGFLREEKILVYPFDWIAVVQPDKSFEVARMT